jgi:hypothetical protein
MTRHRMILGLAACLVIGVFAQQLLSQGGGAAGFSSRRNAQSMRTTNPEEQARQFRMSHEERMRDFRRMAREQETLAMKQSLGVDEQQWKVIEPKLKKVRACRDQAFVGIALPFQSSFTSSVGSAPGQTGGQAFGGGFGGGFQFQSGGTGAVTSSSAWDDPDRPATEGEIICDELQRMLQDPQVTPDQIRQRLDALRQAREKGRRQWALAQQELRKVLNLNQEAKLVMMGLLE